MPASHPRRAGLPAPRLSLVLPLTLAAILLASCALSQSVSAAFGAVDSPDERAFQEFLRKESAQKTYDAFVVQLRKSGVDQVVPPWTLWRQGTDWRRLGEPAFAVPPSSQFAEIIPTLRVLRDDVIPVTGRVEVVSGFRTSRYNQRAGGAAGSRHKWFEAVDVIPRRTWTRDALHQKLLGIWRRRGPATKLGLGLYSRTRFHVDTHRHRRW